MQHLTPEERSEFDPIDFGEAPELSYRRLRDVLVLRMGICFKNGLIVGNSIHKMPHLLPLHAALAYGSWLRRRVVRVDPEKTYVVVHNIWSSGYFHWLTESLPRLRPIIDLLPEMTVLLPSNTALGAVMQRSLACFGVQNVEFFPPDVNVRVPDLVLPDNVRKLHDFSRRNLDFVRNHVLQDTVGAPPGRTGPAKIYMSRERARGRRVVNEAKVLEVLEARGYVRVFPEELDFAEQVRLMQGADSVVAMHGAGLANIMFMRPGTAVLEVHRQVPGRQNWRRGRRSSKVSPYYLQIAAHVGVHYYCLLSPAADLEQPFSMGDVVVDPGTLEKKLDEMEANIDPR